MKLFILVTNNRHKTLRKRVSVPVRRRDLLQHVAVAARALAVDRHDRVLAAALDGRADHAVHLVLHLRVAALHRVKVQRRLRRVLHAARRRAAAQADAVGRTAHLHHQHVLLRLPLVQVPVVQLAHAAREHDRLQVLAALTVRDVAVRDALREGACEARDHRLAELVSMEGDGEGNVIAFHP